MRGMSTEIRPRRYAAVATWSFKRLLRSHGEEPWKIVTNELSRATERGMRKFKSIGRALRFLDVYAGCAATSPWMGSSGV